MSTVRLLMSKVSRALIGWPRSRDPEPACDWPEPRNVEWRNPLEMTSDRCIIRINEMPGPGSAVRGPTPTLSPVPRSWRVRWGRKCWVSRGKLLSNCPYQELRVWENVSSPVHNASSEHRSANIVWRKSKIPRETTVTNDRVSRFTFDVRAHWD